MVFVTNQKRNEFPHRIPMGINQCSNAMQHFFFVFLTKNNYFLMNTVAPYGRLKCSVREIHPGPYYGGGEETNVDPLLNVGAQIWRN